jgi:hypothetical protein
MQRRKTIYPGLWAWAVILAMVLTGPMAWASGGPPSYELCIEQSPATAGTVSPNSGRHCFSANSTVTLSADPQPGYQFACWLGDVSNPTAERTTVLLNGPKIVVAVFQPAPKKHLEAQSGTGGGGFGPGAAIPTAIDLSAPGWSPAGGARPGTRVVHVPVIVTPEPATVLLLALGTLALRRRRR